MGGMPELIHRRHRFQSIAAIDQQPDIAREGRGIARHRDDDGNGALGKLARLRLGALARRVEHQGIDALELLRDSGRRNRSRVSASIGLRPEVMLVACFSAAMASGIGVEGDDPRPLGEAKRERPEAAEQIGDDLGVADVVVHQPRQGLFARRGRLQE